MRTRPPKNILDSHTVYSFGTAIPIDYSEDCFFDKDTVMEKMRPVIANNPIDAENLPLCEFAVKSALFEVVSRTKRESTRHFDTIEDIIKEESGIKLKLESIKASIESILIACGCKEGTTSNGALKEETADEK